MENFDYMNATSKYLNRPRRTLEEVRVEEERRDMERQAGQKKPAG